MDLYWLNQIPLLEDTVSQSLEEYCNMPITETGPEGVKPGLDVMNDTTSEGQLLTGIYQKIIAAPGGPSNIYWGLEKEDLSMLWNFFDWKSVEEHHEFAKSFGKEAVKDLPTILSYCEYTKHLDLTPSCSLALKSEVTEVITLYVPTDVSPDTKAKVTGQLQHFTQSSVKEFPDITATGYGWGVETDFPVRGDKGKSGAMLMALIGLSSIDAHTKFRESTVYKQGLASLKGMEEVIHFAALHLSCRYLARAKQ